jgi:hypothetical protein
MYLQTSGHGQHGKIDTDALCRFVCTLAEERMSLVIVGDLNLPSMDWELNFGSLDGVHDAFLYLCLELNLDQLISDPTQNKNTFDIFLTSDPRMVLDYSIDLPLGASDHNAVLIYFNPVSIGSAKQCKNETKTKMVWDQISVNNAINSLNQID